VRVLGRCDVQHDGLSNSRVSVEPNVGKTNRADAPQRHANVGIELFSRKRFTVDRRDILASVYTLCAKLSGWLAKELSGRRLSGNALTRYPVL
jgi:hypothetical protein